nr:hypothetical protein [Tanacetum cinerariifolium]
MYEKVGLGEPKATRMSLELADRVGDDEVIFDVDPLIKRPPAEDDECYGVDDLDDTINAEALELLENDKSDSFLLKGLEKSINQSDLESYESLEGKAVDNFDSGEPIRRIVFVNTPPVARETAEPNKIKSEHFYSASANEIDEKKPELKNLPHHLEYAYLHGDKSFPIIISYELSKKEKMLLLQVLEKRKGAFAWKMSNIKGISPLYCTHKILMEDDYKPVIQPQRRQNPNVQDVVKNEIVKLLDSRLIYPISDSSWVSPIYVVPKKRGMTIGFFQIPITPEDQEKTTFTCPYGTFAYRRMSFGLCNAPATFQRCMMVIFYDMVEDIMEVCMDEFSVFEKLTTVPIIISPDWNVPFELMCDASAFTVGAVLGQRIDGKFKPIYYASQTLNNSYEHYTTTKKELLAVVFSFDKFRPYLILSKTVVYTDHSALKLENPDLGAFTKEEITDEFPDEHLMILKTELNDDEP